MHRPPRRTGLGRRMADIVQASDTLRSAEEPGRLLGGPGVVPLDVVPFAMLVADGSGAVRTVNQAWIELSGLDSRASLGSGWLAAVGDPDRTTLQDAIHRAVSGFGPARCRSRWNASDRGVTWRVAAVRRAGDILVGIGVDVDPVPVAAPEPAAEAMIPATAPLAATAPPEPAEPAVTEPVAAVLRLVTEPAPAEPKRSAPVPAGRVEEDPLAPAVVDLFRSLDALVATIDRLAERLLIQDQHEMEPLPA